MEVFIFTRVRTMSSASIVASMHIADTTAKSQGHTNVRNATSMDITNRCVGHVSTTTEVSEVKDNPEAEDAVKAMST